MDNQQTNPKLALLDRLQQATNILVTVSSDPSIDELAACLGLTLWVNKLGKHGTAVFSGKVPSTLEFLQPEATLEKNTDSLRDFIIALDKSKADKLRYKVEDSVVKIFITPYRTSLSADDLEYSQGDFNVDMVIAMGVTSQQDLDTAITSHGRILHDATVATITTAGASELGSINWNDSQASSLSELIVDLGNSLGKEHLDGQIATALLTGVVAETARFSNEKTTPQTMSVSAELMAAGANQQLVASKLDEPEPQPEPEAATEPPSDDVSESDNTAEAKTAADGTLEITHNTDEDPAPPDSTAEPDLTNNDEASNSNDTDDNPEPNGEPTSDEPESQPEQQPSEPQISEVKETAPDDQQDRSAPEPDAPPEPFEASSRSSKLVTEPPSMGGMLTANSRPDDIMLEPASDPLTLVATGSQQPLLDRSDNSDNQGAAESQSDAPAAELPFVPPQPAPPDWMPQLSDQPIEPDETLSDIERAVHSPHVEPSKPADLSSARDEVMKAINSVPDTNLEPVQALNAQAIDLGPPPEPWTPPAPQNTAFDPSSFEISNDVSSTVSASPANRPTDMPQPPAPAADQIDPDLTTPVEQPYTLPLPSALTPPAANPLPQTAVVNDPSAPPPVPPPLMPPGFPPLS